jgi:WD40 repeat protein/tetratricopeptide (TPR) repeat protein
MAETNRIQPPPTHAGVSGDRDAPARRLLSLWRQGQEPRVEEFLAQAGVHDPGQILEVLLVDQAERFRLGRGVPAETYLESFPKVRGDPDQAVDLVFGEYLVREELGEQPAPEEYLRRFPQYGSALRLQVELHNAMGADHERTADPGERTAMLAHGREVEPGAESELLPDIPGYEVLGVLGRGGMGVVYRAWQKGLNRQVALKMVHAGGQASPQVLARFRVEAEAVARLQHPNIVQVHEVGQHTGSPFLVLELIEGQSLAQWLAGTPRSARQAAELVETLARAIHSAHCQGVVHRDLTPANVLLTADDRPKISDFGLAKLLFGGGDLRTQTGELLGTPSYMAPEQAASRHVAIGAATDVYALGAILYEALTGRPPFKAESALETLRQVVTDEPVAPSRLRPKLPRDLETICLKCLRKEPAQRYVSADALADDLRRFLDGRPILARRSSMLQRGWRWCRRNKLLAATSFAFAAAVLILTVGATVAAWTFRAQLEQIRQAEALGRVRLFESLTDQARARRYSRQVGQRFKSLEVLEQAAALGRELKLPAESLGRLRDEAIACLALPDLKEEQGVRVIRRPPEIFLVAFDPGMTRYALRSRDGVQVRRVADDQEVARFEARGDHEIYLLSFSPDGRYLATTYNPGSALRVWDLQRRAVAVDDPGPGSVGAAKFSPDSLRIAATHKEGEVLVYDLATGQPSLRRRVPGAWVLDFRCDGAQIAVLSKKQHESTCEILETGSGRLVRSIPLRASAASVAWSPDGVTLATPRDDEPKIDLWAATSGARKATLEGHNNFGLGAAFHPAGTLLASNGWENRLWLWDAVLGRPWLNLAADSRILQFSRDGDVVIARGDRLVRYQSDPALEYRALAHASNPPLNYQRASIRCDGRLLAVGTNRGVVLWDLARGAELAFLPIGLAWHTTFEPSGNLVSNGTLGVWRWPVRFDPVRGAYRIGPPHRLPLPASDCFIDEDRKGRIVALADYATVHVLTSDREFHVGPLENCRAVAVSPHGQWLATGSHAGGGIKIWRARDGGWVADLASEGFGGVLFSPDGRWLLSTSPPCRLWAVDTWQDKRQIDGTGLCFSPDGRLLVVQDASKVVLLVETETGRKLARLESPDLCAAQWATFSPDGSRLVVTTNDRPAPSVHVWDLRAIRRRLAKLRLDWDAPPLPTARTSSAEAEVEPAIKVDVDFGPLKRYSEQYQSHLEQYSIPADELVATYTERLRARPDDVGWLHQRGHALLRLNRFDEGLADFSGASDLRPNDAHLRTYRGVCLFNLKRYAQALDQLEPAFQADPETSRAIVNYNADINTTVRGLVTFDMEVNNVAWTLANAAEPRRNAVLAARLAAFCVGLSPGEQASLNTLGVALYRAGRFAEAIETLGKSLKSGKGQFDGFDLFFLAMAHHRLGHGDDARTSYQRGLRWLGEQKSLSGQDADELAKFRAEAESLLRSRAGELPADVFSRPP